MTAMFATQDRPACSGFATSSPGETMNTSNKMFSCKWQRGQQRPSAAKALCQTQLRRWHPWQLRDAHGRGSNRRPNEERERFQPSSQGTGEVQTVVPTKDAMRGSTCEDGVPTLWSVYYNPYVNVTDCC